MLVEILRRVGEVLKATDLLTDVLGSVFFSSTFMF